MEKSNEPLIGPAVPYPLGYAEASVATQTVAAPLLAGASLTLLGVIVVDAGDFRWPGLTLLIVVTASIALIASMQIGADARQYLYNQETINAWYTDDQQRHSRALRRRTEHFIQWKVRNRRAVIVFNTGTMLLILAVSTALVPPHDDQAIWRWIAAGLALASAAVEAWWVYRLFHKTFEVSPEKPKSLDGGMS
ncbi:hypothetical protein [Streptomyces sp. Y7]|uniref:hypothetical protein n=1 Tax=Streptomyces sp. Y7 TaxID=3342392 RepID=UPI003721AE4A